jgi:hypothetical protein
MISFVRAFALKLMKQRRSVPKASMPLSAHGEAESHLEYITAMAGGAAELHDGALLKNFAGEVTVSDEPAPIAIATAAT